MAPPRGSGAARIRRSGWRAGHPPALSPFPHDVWLEPLVDGGAVLAASPVAATNQPGQRGVGGDGILSGLLSGFHPDAAFPPAHAGRADNPGFRVAGALAANAPFFFYLGALGPALPRRWVLAEDFTTTARMDPAASGAVWGGGALRPGLLGGTGLHGPFQASDGRFLGMDGEVAVWEWSTDDQRIPASRTLTGREERVTDGVFAFVQRRFASRVVVEG